MPERTVETRASDPALLAGAALLCGLILAVDLSLPLGVAGGVPYVALVCFGWFFRGSRQIVLLGAVSSVLAVVGYHYSPDGGIEWMVLVNRSLALFAIWVTVLFLVVARRAHEAAEWARESLEREIVEREQTERTIRERGALLRHAQAMAKLGSFIWDDTTSTCIYCSEELARLCGMSVEEYLEERGNDEGVVAAVHPDDRDRYLKVVETATELRTPYDVEFRSYDKAGRLGHWREMGEPEFDASGRLVRTFGTVQDITEIKQAETALRESEARFRAVVNHSPTKIHIKDLEGRYILINRLAEKLFGVTEEEARGKTAQEIFAPEQADDFEAHDRAILATGRTIAEEEEWPQEDGLHTYLTVKFPILDADGSITAIGAIGTDITERRESEVALTNSEQALQERVAELEETHKMLEEQGGDLVRVAGELKIAHARAEAANRAKSEFLASMSHELRTPLNAIIGFSEIIKEQAFGPVGSERYCGYAEDICHSGQHLLSLINDILDLSKVESGAADLHEEDLEVQAMADSALRLVRERARKGGIELSLEVQDDMPLVHADERKLKQILVNLLTNAVKFTDAGGAVTLKAWCRPDSGFVFQVVDTGIGMAPDDIPKALSQFGQIDSDLNRKYEGTGLGLPLSKSLIELHGGSLDLQSQLGAGTTATVRLPAVRIVQASSTDGRTGEARQAAR